MRKLKGQKFYKNIIKKDQLLSELISNSKQWQLWGNIKWWSNFSPTNHFKGKKKNFPFEIQYYYFLSCFVKWTLENLGDTTAFIKKKKINLLFIDIYFKFGHSYFYNKCKVTKEMAEFYFPSGQSWIRWDVIEAFYIKVLDGIHTWIHHPSSLLI